MNKLRKNTYKLRTSAFGLACILLAIVLVSGCINDSHDPTNSKQVDTVVGKRYSSLRQVKNKPDTIKKQEYIPPAISKEAMQKAVIYRRDSSFHVFNNIRADYRIIGYASPDTNSRRMILFSVFTSDVENNPFRCPYGSYYDSAQGEKLIMKYVGKHQSFIEVIVSWMQKKPEKIYFENKWVDFDN